MKYRDLIEATLRSSPQPEWELRGIARGLLALGYERDALVSDLCQYMDALRGVGREQDLDVLIELMTYFEGWCLPRLAL